ncbi:guanylate-binding protein [Thraustotheca clavata]|uniref:Guanylate-binding protein n=1 Tax=Thraustotheca clavata TaxID=74557 RepID=A0A1V9Z3L1_9STRA|nr:guanylate-binding protein [Thraustotheca clavata]
MNTIFTPCEPEGGPQPMYTCEVCKISMRSAKKLEDHVNHSPLHKATLQESEAAFRLELNGGKMDDRPISPCRQRLIYDGTKLFWRVNETLELHIYEAINASMITVVGQKTQARMKIQPLVLDLQLLYKCIAQDNEDHKQNDDEEKSQTAKREAIIKYILSRLHASKDNSEVISLHIQKQNTDQYDPTITNPSNRAHAIVSDTLPRRRHTYDDAKIVQKDLDVHTEALKTSRQAAEKHSEGIRLALDAFIDLGASVKSHPREASLSWLGAYNRVRQRHDVDVIKARMKHGHDTPFNQTPDATMTMDHGFAVGGTINACTKGIWMWGEPYVLEDGTSVIFLDTEGIGSVDREQTHDTRLFALALLLGSYFVYNSRGVIDGNAVEDLSLVVNLSKHIQTSATSQSNPGALHEFFPSFLWVVRDFTLQLLDNGKEITSKQYLENALKPQGGFSADVAARDQIRALLSDFFRDRDCVTLVRPVEDEAQLRNLPNIPYGELREEFRSKFETMKKRLFEKAQPKALFGKALNGAMFTNLAKSYVEALNSGKAPVISSAWSRVVQAQCEDAVDEAVEMYKKQMNTRVSDYIEGKEGFSDILEAAAEKEFEATANAQIINVGGGSAQFDEYGNLKRYTQPPPMPPSDLTVSATATEEELVAPKPVVRESITLPATVDEIEEVHALCLQHAEKVLKNADIGDQPDMQAFKTTFRLATNSILEVYKQKNAAASMIYCKNLLTFLTERKFNRFHQPELSPLEYYKRTSNYLTELDAVYEDYRRMAVGPSADAAYCAFMSQNIFNQAIEWTEDTNKAHASALGALQNELSTISLQVASAQGQATAMKELAQQDILKSESSLKEAERKSKAEVDALRASLEYKTHELEHVLNHNATLRRLADTAQQSNFRANEVATNKSPQLYAGYLIKQGRPMPNAPPGTRVKWQQRYFVLNGPALRYYNTKDDFERARSDDPPIDVSRAVIEEDKEVPEAFTISFPDNSHYTLHLHAKSTYVKDEWIEQLLKVRRNVVPRGAPSSVSYSHGSREF